MGAVYLAGVLSSFGYTQLMVMAAQKITAEIRKDLFCHIQKLPLKYFDTRTHGDIMSVLRTMWIRFQMRLTTVLQW